MPGPVACLGTTHPTVSPRVQDGGVVEDNMKDARRRINVLYSYVVATDSGFAPNPFFGLCTLACCKPAIRKSVGARLLRQSENVDIRELRTAEPDFVRDQNIWVVGLAGASLSDRPRRSIVYAMQVTDVLDFESYFEEHPEKRPKRNGLTPADPAWHGAAIYTGNDPATARQLAPCSHSAGDQEDEGNKHHDLNGRYVLVSDHFVYFGADAPYDPVERRLHHGRGHSAHHSPEVIAELEALLNGPWAELFDDSRNTATTPSISARGCRGSR